MIGKATRCAKMDTIASHTRTSRRLAKDQQRGQHGQLERGRRTGYGTERSNLGVGRRERGRLVNRHSENESASERTLPIDIDPSSRTLNAKLTIAVVFVKQPLHPALTFRSFGPREHSEWRRDGFQRDLERLRNLFRDTACITTTLWHHTQKTAKSA